MAAEVLFFKATSWRMQPMTDSTKLQYSYNPIVEPKTDTHFLQGRPFLFPTWTALAVSTGDKCRQNQIKI